jgi:hypothetical protein
MILEQNIFACNLSVLGNTKRLLSVTGRGGKKSNGEHLECPQWIKGK